MSHDADKELVSRAGPAMFQLGRLIPRTVAQVVSARTDQALAIQHVLVVDAIDAQFAAGDAATVGAVAVRVGVDPSTASRLVAQAVRSGNVERFASQDDGRRVQLRLTGQGRELLRASRRFQQAIYDDLTREWPEHDRQDLARLMIRLADEATTRQAQGR